VIPAIIKTSLTSLRRDRGALALSFVLPIAFFTIFAVIFGTRRDTTPRITVLLVDEDHSTASQRLIRGLENEGSLHVLLRPAPKNGIEQPEYTAITAEAAVRTQLGALSTLVILIMSSIGGSMFPRFLMPEAMQKAGLLTINAWTIDGFTKVFWRDEPATHLWPQVAVLLVTTTTLFVIARRLSRRWEYA
jgi:hypothetical protein